MKTFTRWLLALLLIATPTLALVEWASANTELVPAARLVAPYWDIAGSRSTLIMLTNVAATVDLLTSPTPGAPQPARGVHVEFYDKTCVRQDMTVDLSGGDLDQLDLKALGIALPSGQGWVDMDVRAGDAQRSKDSIQCNVLIGTVVNSDSAGDFAVAYPMASVIGSSTASFPAVGKPCSSTYVGDTIGTHNVNNAATGWTGRYEPFPSRLFVPFFFAEGGPLGQTSQVVIAAPADGNWYNSTGGGSGEAPGQLLPGLSLPVSQAGWLMSGTALFYDACENKVSRSFGGHWINNKLSDAIVAGGAGLNLGSAASQSFPWTHPGLACDNQVNFPSADDDSAGAGKGASIGWLDVPNTGVSDSSVIWPRGMVGILIQNTTIGKKEGDVIRLYGDPFASGSGRGSTDSVGITPCAGAASCPRPYSLVDRVVHTDLNP